MDAEVINVLADKLGIAVKSTANFFYDLIPQYVTLHCLQLVRNFLAVFFIAAVFIVVYCMAQSYFEIDEMRNARTWRVDDFKKNRATIQKAWIKRATVVCIITFVYSTLLILLSCLQYVLAPQAAIVQELLN